MATNTTQNWRTQFNNGMANAKATAAKIKAEVINQYNQARIYVKTTVIPTAQIKYAEAKEAIADASVNASSWLKQHRQTKLSNTGEKLQYINANLQALQNKQASRATYINYANSKLGLFHPFVKLKGWYYNKQYNRDAKKVNALTDEQTYIENRYQKLANKFKSRYGEEMGFVGRKSSKTSMIEVESNLPADEIKAIKAQERAEYLKKQKDPLAYGAIKSSLPEAVMYANDGTVVGHYKHYNSIDNTVDIDLSSPYGQIGAGSIVFQNKMTVKLNDNHELDLSLPENKHLVNNPTYLKDILKEHPEAYKTIPSRYFDNTLGGRLNREDVLDCVREGLKEQVKNAQPDNNGIYRTNIPAQDKNGNNLERFATPEEAAQQIYGDIISKDEELLSYTERSSSAYQTKKTEMEARQQSAQKFTNTKEVDEFFDKAK